MLGTKVTAVVRLVIVSAGFTAPLAAADPAWIAKPASAWTAEDAQEVMNHSPWAHIIPAGITRRQTEDQLREGGRMGQPTGIGYDGVDPKGSGPKVSLNVLTGAGGDDRSARSRARATTLRICWESALPVRLARLKTADADLPVLEGDGYRIAVYGIPGPGYKQDPKELGEPLKRDAVLKREGQKDVRPLSVEVFQQADGYAVVYLFPLTAEITRKDGQVRFEAQIGRFIVAHTFDLKAMEFLGRLDL